MSTRKKADAPREFVVCYPEAFPSYFSEADRLRLREIISTPSRGPRRREAVPSEFPLAVLRTARCAHPKANGVRCGRIIRPIAPVEGGVGHLSYHAQSCVRWSVPPHSTVVSAGIGEHVLDVIREVFQPEQLRQVADRFRVDAAQLTTKHRALQTQLNDLTLKVDIAEDSSVEEAMKAERARRAGDADTAQVHDDRKKKRDKEAIEHRLTVTNLRRQLDELEAQEDEYLSARDGELEKVIALGTDLPALIERARGVPFAVQNIVHALVKRVWLRAYGTSVAELSVEFPSGEEIRRLITFGRIGGTQAERLYAWGRLEAGAPMEEVVRDLARLGQPMKSGWYPERVMGAKLYAEHFERAAVRAGEYRTVEEIAQATGIDRDQVLAAALRAALGPAQWTSGDLALCPSEAELHRALPDYAAREVARVHGLTGETLIQESTLRRLNNARRGTSAGFASGVALYRDRSRRWWVAVSDATARGLRVEGDLGPTAERWKLGVSRWSNSDCLVYGRMISTRSACSEIYSAHGFPQ